MPNIQQQLRVEVAWGSSQSTALASCAWRDETANVRLVDGVSIRRGRSDEQSAFSPGTATFVLDNPSGTYSPGNTGSSLSPNVTLGKPVRIRAKVQSSTWAHNFLSAETASFEGTGGITGWTATAGVTLTRSTARGQNGTKSMQVVWGTTTAQRQRTVSATVDGLVIGRTYVLSAYCWVPSGSVAVRITADSGSPASITGTARATTTTGQWERVACSIVATTTTVQLQLQHEAATNSTNDVFVDSAQVTESADVMTFTTTSASGLYTDVFTGYVTDIDEMPGFLNTVTVSASDRLADLARTTFDTGAVEYARALGTGAFYGMDGKPGATRWGDKSGKGLPDLVRTGRNTPTGASSVWTGYSANEFDTTWTVGGDLYTSTRFNREGTTKGYFAKTTGGTWPSTSSGLTIEGMVYGTQLSGTAFGFSTGTVVYFIELGITIDLKTYTIATAATATLGSGTGTIAAWNHVAVTFEPPSGGNVRWRLYTNGSQAATGTFAAAAVPAISTLYVGGSEYSNLYNTFVANVGIYPSALSALTIAVRSAQLLSGWDGYTTDQRFDLVTSMASVEKSSSSSAITMSAQPHNDRPVVDVLSEIAVTESGSVFVDTSGVVVFRPASFTPPTASVPAKAVRLGSPVSLSDQYVVNELAITQANGGSYTARDQASIDAYGRRGQSITTYAADLLTAAILANDYVTKRKDPVRSVGSLTIDLVTADADLTGGAEAFVGDMIGTRLTVSSIPRGSSSYSLTGVVQGIADQVTPTSWERTFNLTPDY